MKSLQSITVIIYWSLPEGTHEERERERERGKQEESEEREICKNNKSHIFTEQILDETLTTLHGIHRFGNLF